jgi:hypothetical protein
MSTEINTALVKGFKKNFQMLCQQKLSVLRGSVREEPLTGEDDFFDQIGAADGADITDRHGDTQYTVTPHSRRKVAAIPWEWADLIDKQDKVRMLGDPQSDYVKTAVAAANRRIDDHIIAAFFGTAYTGKAGTTAVTYPTSATYVVPVNLSGSNEGMTLNKLIRAKKLLLALNNEADAEMNIAIAPYQLDDLLKITQIGSADYNTVKALVAGEIDRFMGFKFHVSNRLLTDSSSYRRCPVWVTDGVLLGVSSDQDVMIDVLPQKRHSTQVRIAMDMGAVRMEEAKVVEIKCLET